MASSSRSPTAVGPEVLAMAKGVVTMVLLVQNHGERSDRQGGFACDS